MADIKLSIIIVNFNTKELLLRCLDSLQRARGREFWEIILVDNASTDRSIEKIKNVKIIQNTENVGYAKANNQGIRMARGEYILLLNSDTEVAPDAIEKSLLFLKDHPKAGVVTCKVVLAGGNIDPASHRGFPTPWAALTYFVGLEKLFSHSRLFGRYHMGYAPMDRPHQIDSPSGAFFLVRKKVIEEVGMLDEDYFMYGEDIDWAYRIKQKGWEIWYNPEMTILHLKKQSGRGHADDALRRQTDRYFYETMWLFYKKHYMDRYSSLITFFVWFAIRIKLFFVTL